MHRDYARHLKVLAERPGGTPRNLKSGICHLKSSEAWCEAWLEAVTHDPLPPCALHADRLPGRIPPSDDLGQHAWRL